MSPPDEEYTRRLEQRRAQRARIDQRRVAAGMARLAVFVAGVLIAWAGFVWGWISGWWLLLPLVAFFGLGVRLTTLERQSARLERAADYYESGLARLAGRWAGAGATGQRFLDEHHLYARDLDLFGEASLFELLCRARTRMGEERLAAWLLAPAPAAEIGERQAAVGELTPLLDLREDVAVLGATAGAGVHPERLVAWGEAPAALEPSSWQRYGALLLSLGGAVTVAAMFAVLAMLLGEMPLSAQQAAVARVWFTAALLLYGVIGWRFQQGAAPVFAGAAAAAHDVDLLAGVLQRLEAEGFTTPRLARLRAALDSDGQPPSRRIARLHRLMDRLEQRDNVFVRLIGMFLLWDVHLAWALEDWRRASGAAMRRWLDAVGEIEALSSIATYRYEHRDYVFAEIVEPSEPGNVPPAPEHAGEPGGLAASGTVPPPGPSFAAEGLAHPLLPEDAAVPNDVALGGGAPGVLVVSGSNMSGKSTLLRTVGTAAVLAQAGAPVRAARLRMTPLQVGASIRVTDSLQEGESRFYAEILRLRAIVARAEAAAGQGGGSGRSASAPQAVQPAEAAPLLFLIDEFLHGTNSHDRRIGAAAIVKGLAQRGAIGLVTTHDLALTHIADELGERGANVHFEDHLEDGKMSFNYRLRPGVVTKSNALELMRSVGLKVDTG